jgi:hypothetical protein
VFRISHKILLVSHALLCPFKMPSSASADKSEFVCRPTKFCVTVILAHIG